jgi:hypothetical protein
MARMTEVSTMLRSLALIIALLAAGIPASAKMHALSTAGSVHLPQPLRLERPRGLHNDSTDEYDHYLILPLIHGPSDYPLYPPQSEPGVGEYFPCASCPDGVSDWLLLDYNLGYFEIPEEVPEGLDFWCPPKCDLEAGDVLIKVSARIRNDSDVDYWTWMGGSSYDAEGNRLTSSFDPWPLFDPVKHIPAHGTDHFTFHLRSDRAVALICLGVSSSVMPPP